MARTIAEKERIANGIAERLARQAGEPMWRDAEPLRRIADAFRRSVAADAEVAEAVQSARNDDYSWAAIAAMLGVSKQTAQARYGRTPRPLQDVNKTIAYIEERLIGGDRQRFDTELADKNAAGRTAALAGGADADASVQDLSAWLQGWLDRITVEQKT
ncbi:MAG: hypothetical protein ACRDRT_07475 [Pseudonocardiaceae bacterium]